jgi:HKD family nuclease
VRHGELRVDPGCRAAAMLKLSYLDPTSRRFDATLLGWLMNELPVSTAFRFATAYFDASVLDWLAEPLEHLLANGGTVQAGIGSNGGGASPADLRRLSQVLRTGPGGSLHVEYAEGGIFHPKVFVVESPDRVAAVVGSANLTANGSLVNVEAGVVLETDEPGPPAEAPLDAVIASIGPAPMQDVFPINDDDDVAKLEDLGIVGRAVKTAPADITQTKADRQRQGRRAAGVRVRPGVADIPARQRHASAGRSGAGRSRAAGPSQQPQPPYGDYFGVRFTRNDLKTTGTREFSVSASMRVWVEQILGRPIVPGERDLLSIVIEGRLASAPLSIHSTLDPVRIWAAGGSGGTHADVRMVIGNRLREALDAEAIRLTGLGIPEGSIGVFRLPRQLQLGPAQLTVFLPSDPPFPGVEALLGRSGREQKFHFRETTISSLLRWP